MLLTVCTFTLAQSIDYMCIILTQIINYGKIYNTLYPIVKNITCMHVDLDTTGIYDTMIILW